MRPSALRKYPPPGLRDSPRISVEFRPLPPAAARSREAPEQRPRRRQTSSPVFPGALTQMAAPDALKQTSIPCSAGLHRLNCRECGFVNRLTEERREAYVFVPRG